MSDPLLTRELLLRAFSRLDSLLSDRHLTADVFVYGGAAMVLGFDARPSTRDVDALWRPHGPVLDAAKQVALEFGLPRSWLNEQATQYLPAGIDISGAVLFDGSALRVYRAEPDLLLAMKVRAARQSDLPDIAFLAKHLGLTTAEDVIAVAIRVFALPIGDRQRQAVVELFESDAS